MASLVRFLSLSVTSWLSEIGKLGQNRLESARHRKGEQGSRTRRRAPSRAFRRHARPRRGRAVRVDSDRSRRRGRRRALRARVGLRRDVPFDVRPDLAGHTARGSRDLLDDWPEAPRFRAQRSRRWARLFLGLRSRGRDPRRHSARLGDHADRDTRRPSGDGRDLRRRETRPPMPGAPVSRGCSRRRLELRRSSARSRGARADDLLDNRRRLHMENDLVEHLRWRSAWTRQAPLAALGSCPSPASSCCAPSMSSSTPEGASLSG